MEEKKDKEKEEEKPVVITIQPKSVKMGIDKKEKK